MVEVLHSACTQHEIVSFFGIPLASFTRSLQFLDVDLLHLQHGLHGALGFGRVRVSQRFTERSGDDLP